MSWLFSSLELKIYSMSNSADVCIATLVLTSDMRESGLTSPTMATLFPDHKILSDDTDWLAAQDVPADANRSIVDAGLRARLRFVGEVHLILPMVLAQHFNDNTQYSVLDGCGKIPPSCSCQPCSCVLNKFS